MSSFTHYLVKNELLIPDLLSSQPDVTGNFIDSMMTKVQIEITKLTETDIEFDLVGVDASIANALRRILLSEVMDVKK